MTLESSGTILYVAIFSYQWITGLEIVRGGPKLYTDTHTQTHTHTHTHTHKHRHTHTEACFISLVFLRKCRNKTNKKENFQYLLMI